MGGRISAEPTAQAWHRAELIEQHEITEVMPLEAMIHSPGSDAVARCIVGMNDWCTAHDLEPMSVREVRKRLDMDNGLVGVTWNVTVGKGEISPNQTDPGALDEWVWSARVHWWHRVLSRADGRQGRSLSEIKQRTRNPFKMIADANDARLASVTPISDRQSTFDAHSPRVSGTEHDGA